MIALFLLGLIIEALAGFAERWIVYDRKRKLRYWYVKATNPPATWGPAQRWIWKSPQAAAEFARRRLRILVARNSVVVTFLLLLSLLIGLLINRLPAWGYWWLGSLIVGGVLIVAFFYLWIDASAGWNRAVREAGGNESS